MADSDGVVMCLDYSGESGPKVVQGSRRYTTSSRHPGRKNVGTAPKLASADLGELDPCVCGQRADKHPDYARHPFTGPPPPVEGFRRLQAIQLPGRLGELWAKRGS